MKIALHHNGREHQITAMKAMRKGLKKSGHQVVYCTVKTQVQADLHVVWSIKNMGCVSDDYIVLDSGYVNGNTGDYNNDRNFWISFSVNGFHGRGKLHPEAPASDRWEKLGIELKPWRESKRELGLLIGQTPWDAVAGRPYEQWLRGTMSKLDLLDQKYLYRPHPAVEQSSQTLMQQMEKADYVITYCSTTAVEAIFEGVPTITFSDSSIAYPVTSHSIEEELWQGPREPWCHQLAYRQWKLEELVDGSAWEWMYHVFNS